jgi:hypothetical protein
LKGIPLDSHQPGGDRHVSTVTFFLTTLIFNIAIFALGVSEISAIEEGSRISLLIHFERARPAVSSIQWFHKGLPLIDDGLIVIGANTRLLMVVCNETAQNTQDLLFIEYAGPATCQEGSTRICVPGWGMFLTFLLYVNFYFIFCFFCFFFSSPFCFSLFDFWLQSGLVG